jgi:hypothetical protein
MAIPLTYGWLLYRMKDGEPEFMGIYQTEEKAEADAEVIEDVTLAEGWNVVGLPFHGWGMVAPGVFSQNGKPSLTIVK